MSHCYLFLGPNSMAKVSVDENRDGTYTVTYIPVEVGMFTLKIFWSDKQIPGNKFIHFI